MILKFVGKKFKIKFLSYEHRTRRTIKGFNKQDHQQRRIWTSNGPAYKARKLLLKKPPI
jgi:hypothetical protein